MGVRIESSESVITAYIFGEIDHHCAKEIRDEIDEITERMRPEILILDFRDVTFMDSSGIGLVMGRYKLIKEIGGELKVINVSGYIKKVMKLAGLDTLVSIEEGGKRNETNK